MSLPPALFRVNRKHNRKEHPARSRGGIIPDTAGTAHLKEDSGAPGRTRTANPQLRRLMLYPIELRARVWDLRGASDYNGNSCSDENPWTLNREIAVPRGFQPRSCAQVGGAARNSFSP